MRESHRTSGGDEPRTPADIVTILTLLLVTVVAVLVIIFVGPQASRYVTLGPGLIL